MAEQDPHRIEPLALTRESGHQHPLPGVFTTLSGRLLLGLCLLQFGLLGWLIWRDRQLSNPAPRPLLAARAKAPPPGSPEPFLLGHPGPWGALEYIRITIEPPDEYVPVDERAFEKTRWVFGGQTPEQVAAFFNACDLTAGQRAELANPAVWSPGTNATVVSPSPQLILGLSQSARARIYSLLAQDERNDFQMWPYTFRTGGFDAWFERSGCSDATVALVGRLTYLRGSSVCFSDLPEVFSQIPTIAERRRLVKTLSRNSTVLMKLRIKPDTGVDALMGYWKGTWRAKDIKPMIESLTRVPGGAAIDIAQLLPKFARQRLNTYPVPDPSTPAIDCYWTAMNFFRDPPDDRYYDPTVWRNELTTNYTIVSQPAFGDLVFFLRPDDRPIHAAVFVADDVVFTKNGGNDRQPWILMKWDDLIARYPQEAAVRPVFFHRTAPLK
jgi:hypothetical protein